MKRILLAVSIGLPAAVSPVSATAQGTDTAPDTAIVANVNVRHGDLDLADKAGAETMLVRLEKAAAKACGGKSTSPTSLDHQMAQARLREHRRCKAAAIDSATLKLGAPVVRAAWLGRAKATHHAAKVR